jgi:hypothetical protein
MTTAQDLVMATASIAVEMFADLEKGRSPEQTPGQMLGHLLRARRSLDRIIARVTRDTQSS